MRRKMGAAVILITHDLGVVSGRSDRLAVMYAGYLVEYGPTAQLLAAPTHPYLNRWSMPPENWCGKIPKGMRL